MSQYDLIISGGTIANSTETFSADLGIRDGRIVAIAEQLDGVPGELAPELDSRVIFGADLGL